MTLSCFSWEISLSSDSGFTSYSTCSQYLFYYSFRIRPGNILIPISNSDLHSSRKNHQSHSSVMTTISAIETVAINRSQILNSTILLRSAAVGLLIVPHLSTNIAYICQFVEHTFYQVVTTPINVGGNLGTNIQFPKM